MEMKFCQSCGMPLQAEDQWGMNADGSLNEEYCCYCYHFEPDSPLRNVFDKITSFSAPFLSF